MKTKSRIHRKTVTKIPNPQVKIQEEPVFVNFCSKPDDRQLGCIAIPRATFKSLKQAAEEKGMGFEKFFNQEVIGKFLAGASAEMWGAA
ncbi:MAG TPA: hypothetical protein VIK59_09235 [Verrucomicrobiae bacterium]